MSPVEIHHILMYKAGRPMVQEGFGHGWRWLYMANGYRQVITQYFVDAKTLLVMGGSFQTAPNFSVVFVRELEISGLTPTALLDAWREAEVFTWQTSFTQPSFATVAP